MYPKETQRTYIVMLQWSRLPELRMFVYEVTGDLVYR